MLINFEAKNIFSFNSNPGICFSMRPGKYREHPEVVTQESDTASVKVLRLGLLYGHNSSGKSNLLKSMSVFRDLVIRNKARYLTRFRFEENPATYLSATFLTPVGILQYTISFTNEKVLSEKLLQGKKLNSLKTIYSREGSSFQPHFTDQYSDAFKNFLKNTEGRIRPEQLAINKLHDDNIDQFCTETAARPYCALWDWFKKIEFIYPNSCFKDRKFIGQDMAPFVKHFLQKINIDVDIIVHKTPLQDEVEKEKYKDLQKNRSYPIKDDNNMRYIFRDEMGELYRCEIVFKRKGKEFLLGEESRGVKYLLEILPLLYWCQDVKQKSTYRTCFIDELGLRLHPDATQSFITEFLSYANLSQHIQLIATTHDPSLVETVRMDCVKQAYKREDATIYTTKLVRSDATKYKKMKIVLNTK